MDNKLLFSFLTTAVKFMQIFRSSLMPIHSTRVSIPAHFEPLCPVVGSNRSGQGFQWFRHGTLCFTEYHKSLAWIYHVPYRYIEFQWDKNHVQCGQGWHLPLELLQTCCTSLMVQTENKI